MNMETGEIIDGTHEDFQELMNRGALMPLDKAEKESVKSLKKKLARTQVALIDEIPLSKNAAKRRRKLIKTKKVTS
jgi:hypothetical protein